METWKLHLFVDDAEKVRPDRNVIKRRHGPQEEKGKHGRRQGRKRKAGAKRKIPKTPRLERAGRRAARRTGLGKVLEITVTTSTAAVVVAELIAAIVAVAVEYVKIANWPV